MVFKICSLALTSATILGPSSLRTTVITKSFKPHHLWNVLKLLLVFIESTYRPSSPLLCIRSPYPQGPPLHGVLASIHRQARLAKHLLNLCYCGKKPSNPVEGASNSARGCPVLSFSAYLLPHGDSRGTIQVIAAPPNDTCSLPQQLLRIVGEAYGHHNQGVVHGAAPEGEELTNTMNNLDTPPPSNPQHLHRGIQPRLNP